MMALRAKIFEYKDQKIRRRTQKTFFYGPNNMEPLNIPYIADTTISGGTFQTPILQNITHGQRNNSRLWHTREDNGLPFHYSTKKGDLLKPFYSVQITVCRIVQLNFL